jgi:type I restriction enzyme S subunit
MTMCWSAKKLECLVDPSRPITYGVVKPGDHDENGITFVRGGDISKGRIAINQLRTIRAEVSARYKRTLLRGGELLISLVGNPGEVAIAPPSLAGANIARQVGLVALGGEVNSQYVMYFLMSPLGRAGLGAYMKGSVQVVINLADLRTVEVPLPPLSTQRKIAAILSAYDDLIENNLRRIKILEEMAQNLYREWFVKYRFPGHQHARFTDSPLGRIPEGWEVNKLGDVFDFSNGYAFYKDGYSEKGKLVVDLGNITEDRSFKLTGKDKFVSEIQYNLKSKFHLNKFDIVVAMTDMTQRMGILGKVAIIDKSNSYILNQRVGRLRPKDNKLDYSFIYTTLSDERFVQEMKVLSKGAVQKYFNTNDILNYNVLMPSADYIKKINKINLSLLEYRMLLKEKTDNLHHTRDILLPRLISGEVDVSALDITIPMEAMT